MISILKKISYSFIKWYRDKYIPVYGVTNAYAVSDIDEASIILKRYIDGDLPCMISRFGANEMDCYMNYRHSHPLSFLRKVFPFWIGENTKIRMKENAGFFPIDNGALAQFSDLTNSCIHEIDVLVSWLNQEGAIDCFRDVPKVRHLHLEPYWSKNPWTEVLKGKKVLVVHPFVETIRSQYEKRKYLFKDPRVLPDFQQLITIKAVQSIGGKSESFDTWFDALRYMENQIDQVDYDVALIGCGAYGMPLAAHCKKMGKKAVHMGGALQLLFGIKGGRWENPNYCQEFDYSSLFNEYWVYPAAEERPSSADKVENACYW